MVWFVIRPAFKRLPSFMWALREVLISYVVWFAVNILPHSSAMRAIIWLLFALLAGIPSFHIDFAGHFIF